MTIVSELDRALAGLRGGRGAVVGTKVRRASKKRCSTCGGPTRPWAGLDWCPRCMSGVGTKSLGGKRRSAAVGPRGGRTEIQSYLFPRALWTEAKAKAWAKKHNLYYGSVDVTDRYIRLRQAEPSEFRSMRTKCLCKRKGKCIIKSVVGIR
jgi:hypothetical protein